MTRSSVRACVFCAVLMSEVVGSAGDIDASLRDRFLKAVRQTVWKSEKVSFRAKCVGTRIENSETETQNYAFRGPLVLATGTNRGTEYVRSKNSEYAFQVNRASEAKAKAYSLSFIEQLDTSGAMDRRIQQTENAARSDVFGGWYLWGETVVSVVESPTFQFKRVAAENRDGTDLVRIEFDRQYADRNQRNLSYTDGFMVCDPDRHWVMVEYGMTCRDGLITSRTTLTYGELIDGLPIPKLITRRNVTRDDKGDLNWGTVATLEMIGGDVPREEFYLSHYGLPEPNFRRGWFGTWVWYLIAGVVCLGVAAIIVKRQRARLA